MTPNDRIDALFELVERGSRAITEQQRGFIVGMFHAQRKGWQYTDLQLWRLRQIFDVHFAGAPAHQEQSC